MNLSFLAGELPQDVLRWAWAVAFTLGPRWFAERALRICERRLWVGACVGAVCRGRALCALKTSSLGACLAVRAQINHGLRLPSFLITLCLLYLRRTPCVVTHC